MEHLIRTGSSGCRWSFHRWFICHCPAGRWSRKPGSTYGKKGNHFRNGWRRSNSWCW